jgi:hypothetical protein
MREAVVVGPRKQASALGELRPGVSKTAVIYPSSTGGVKLRFMDERDQLMTLDLSGYVESGYAGYVDVDVKDGQIVRLIHKLNVSFLPF